MKHHSTFSIANSPGSTLAALGELAQRKVLFTGNVHGKIAAQIPAVLHRRLGTLQLLVMIIRKISG